MNSTALLPVPIDRARLARDCEQLAAGAGLSGPGAAAVRSLARQLALALELFQQQERRLRAEVLRHEEPKP